MPMRYHDQSYSTEIHTEAVEIRYRYRFPATAINTRIDYDPFAEAEMYDYALANLNRWATEDAGAAVGNDQQCA